MHNAALWKQFEGQWVDSSYRLEALLGVGGFGGVFLAAHEIEGTPVRNVAVKLIFPDPENADKQLGELIAASTLHHPGLLRCFHAGSTTLSQSKLLFLVMELGDESLQSRLERGVLSVSEINSLIEEIVSALIWLHQQKRVHRDLKPGNVLRVGNAWKLSDFGTLRLSKAATTSHTDLVIGSMRYMPPESFDGMVSPAWDVWSLGILVMEALTGQKPFEATSQQQVIRLILTQEPIIPKGLPLPYDEVIRHCLIKDHHTRWSAEQVLEVVRQHQRAIGTRQPKFTSRIHTKLWWATGAVLIVLVIVLGILSKSGGRKPEPLRSESVQITDEQHQPRENSSTTAGARPLPHQEPKRPVAGSVPASEMQPAIRATLPKQLELEPKRSGVQVQCAGVKSFGFYLYASGGAMIGGGSCQPGGTYTFSVPPGNYRLSQPNPVQFFPLEITVDEGRTTEVTPPVGHVAFSGFEVPVKDTFGARTEKSEYLTLYRMGGQRDRDEWTWRCLLGTICVYDIAPGNYTAEFQFVNKRVSVAVAPEQTTTIQPPR